MAVLSLSEVLTVSLMTWLTAGEASLASRVCRQWHTTAFSDEVWRLLFLTEWSTVIANSNRLLSSPPAPESKQPNGRANWRSRFYEQKRISRNWKNGVWQESLLLGHTAHVNTLICDANYIVR